MDLVKDGQITTKENVGYLKIKGDFGRYITMRIILFDSKQSYEPLKRDLINAINNEIYKINN